MDSIVSSSNESSSTPRQPSRKPITCVAVVVDRLAHDGADDRVQARTVSTAGKHADAHGENPMVGYGSASWHGAPTMLCAIRGSRSRGAGAARPPGAGAAAPHAPDRARSGARDPRAAAPRTPLRVRSADGTSSTPRCSARDGADDRAGTRLDGDARATGSTRSASSRSDFRVVAYDLRGHGQSGRRPSRRLLDGALRRGRRGGARGRSAGRRARDRRRPLARRDVDRRLGRAPRRRRRAPVPRRCSTPVSVA